MSDQNKKKIIELGETELSEILKDYESFIKKMEQLRRGENPFEREEKKRGGSVGSLMDLDIRTPTERVFRIALSEGGMTRDEEIAFHLFIVNMSPKTDSDAFAVEQSRDWLMKNLTPAEQRSMDFPR